MTARQRARALGFWGEPVGLSFALGPVLGGALVSSVGWPSVFWINIPIALVALGLTTRLIPESRSENPRRFDPAGQVLVMVTLATLLPSRSSRVTASAGSSATELSPGGGRGDLRGAVLAAFRACTPGTDPPTELRFFRSLPFSGATLVAVAAFAAMAGFLFLNTLYLQIARHFSAVRVRALRAADPRGDAVDLRPDRGAPSSGAAARGRLCCWPGSA